MSAFTGGATGAMAGAGAGATVGSAFPGYGTAIGAAVGAIGGGVLGTIEGSEQDAKDAVLRRMQEEEERKRQLREAMEQRLFLKRMLLDTLDRGRQDTANHLAEYNRNAIRGHHG